MASHPGCWSSPANNLARLAHGVEHLVCDAVHTGWEVGDSTQAETRPHPVKAPESFSEPPFSLPPFL